MLINTLGHFIFMFTNVHICIMLLDVKHFNAILIDRLIVKALHLYRHSFLTTVDISIVDVNICRYIVLLVSTNT